MYMPSNSFLKPIDPTFFLIQLQLESLPAMVAGVWSDDRNSQLEATTHFRKLLSIGSYFICGPDSYLFFWCIIIIIFNLSAERSPPINEVIQSGVVPRFIEFLSRDDFPQLQVQTRSHTILI